MAEGFDGDKLRAVRLAKGIRQNALAKAVGKSKSYICDLERGRSTPGVSTLIRLAAALGEKDISAFLK